MKSLVIGLGIGELYKTVLTGLNSTVVTVDSNPNKNADYQSVDDALKHHQHFDTVNICTPNFTHKELAEKVAPYTKIVFIEKPGVSTSADWIRLIEQYPATRFMMIKNNMWRDNIAEMKMLADPSTKIEILWVRNNCVPNPGSWFTTKSLSYGGVSRDLMPHLLSIYIALNPNWRNSEVNYSNKEQMWSLSDIDSTDYGTVNSDGIYDVDDFCRVFYDQKWFIESCWRSLNKNVSEVNFYQGNDLIKKVELGWCPEDAYYNMIKDAVENIDNDDFWKIQLEQDIWIHKQIEEL